MVMGQSRSSINIVLGSNHFIGTSGLIQIKGKELFRIDLISYRDTFKPLITVEIRDENNTLLGKAYRSTSFVHCHPDYEAIIETEEGQTKRLALKRRADGVVVFDLKFTAPNEVEINGIFYAENIDYPIIATSEYLDINTNKFSRMKIYKKGTGIKLDEDFISI